MPMAYEVEEGKVLMETWLIMVRALLFVVDTSKPPLMGRPAATPGLIHTKPRSAYGRRPKQQGWLHQGLTAGGQSVAEL